MDEELELPSEFYSRLQSDRKPFEDRAKLIAKYTLPYLIREVSDTGNTQMLDTTNQSYGGRLINTLKAKMGMALLPPSTSSFRYVPNPEELAALTGGSPDNIAKTHAAMSANIAQVNNEIEIQQIRTTLFDLIAQLLVVGSVVVEKVKTKQKKGQKLHTLMNFVVDLEDTGEPIAICFVETVKVLPDGIEMEKQDEYKLFTMASMDKDTGSWIVRQEIEQQLVGKEQKFKDYMDLPYRYLGWTWMVGDYCHRPYTEDYIKDIEQLDKLAKLLTDGSIIAAKSLLLVNERGGRTRKDDVSDSANGDIIDGVADDITSFQFNKNFDFQMPMEREAKLKKELAFSFLMNEAATRDAERVTAQEINFMAKELETSSLAGIYSKMALQYSKWNVHQIMKELGVKFESIEVEILTGLDALGRSQAGAKLDSLVQRAAQMDLLKYFDDSELLSRYASYEGIDTTNLLKTPQQIQQMEQQQMSQLAEQAGEQSLLQSAGQAVGQSVVPQQ